MLREFAIAVAGGVALLLALSAVVWFSLPLADELAAFFGVPS